MKVVLFTGYLTVLDPFGIFLEKEGGAAGVEGGPHKGIVAEAEDEEVAGGKRSEDVEGDTDLADGLLRDHLRCGVVEYGPELDRRGFHSDGAARKRVVWVLNEEAN
ncbi:hypothetical protein U1Q18_017288, partial [Sarracenia purpurea var. burkii]